MYFSHINVLRVSICSIELCLKSTTRFLFRNIRSCFFSVNLNSRSGQDQQSVYSINVRYIISSREIANSSRPNHLRQVQTFQPRAHARSRLCAKQSYLLSAWYKNHLHPNTRHQFQYQVISPLVIIVLQRETYHTASE